MITETEMNWVRQALAVDHSSAMNKAKTYRVIGQIFENAARRIEAQLVDSVDAKLERNYQDLQNKKLVDILKA